MSVRRLPNERKKISSNPKARSARLNALARVELIWSGRASHFADHRHSFRAIKLAADKAEGETPRQENVAAKAGSPLARLCYSRASHC